MEPVFMSIAEIEEQNGSSGDELPEGVDKNRALYVILYSSERENVTPTAYSFDVFDDSGKPLKMLDYCGEIGRDVVNTDEFTKGEGVILVPEGTESGSKFTAVLTYEIDGVTYGVSKEYTWYAE